MDVFEFVRILTILMIIIEKQALGVATTIDENLESKDCEIVCGSLPEYNCGSLIKVNEKLVCHCQSSKNGTPDERYEAYIFLPLAKDFLTESRKCTLLCREKSNERKYGVLDSETCYCYDSIRVPDYGPDSGKQAIKSFMLENINSNEDMKKTCITHCKDIDTNTIAYDEPAPSVNCICFDKNQNCDVVPYLPDKFKLNKGLWAPNVLVTKKHSYGEMDMHNYCKENFNCFGIVPSESTDDYIIYEDEFAKYNALCLGCSCTHHVALNPLVYRFQCYPLPKDKKMITDEIKTVFSIKKVLNAFDEKLASEDCCIVCRSLSEYNHGKVIKIKGKFTCHCTVTDPVVEDLYEAYIFFPLAQDFFTKSRKCTLLCKQKNKKHKYGAFDKDLNECYCFDSITAPKIVENGIKSIYPKNMVTNEDEKASCVHYCESLKLDSIPFDEPVPLNICVCFNRSHQCDSVSYLSDEIQLKTVYLAANCPEIKKEHYFNDDIDKYCTENFLCSGIECDASKDESTKIELVPASYNASCLGCSCNPMVKKDPVRFRFQCHPLPMEKTKIDPLIKDLFLLA